MFSELDVTGGGQLFCSVFQSNNSSVVFFSVPSGYMQACTEKLGTGKQVRSNHSQMLSRRC